MKKKVFQVITLLHPKDEKSETKLISKGIETVLATDEKQAGVLAARMIPESEIKNLDRVEVVVRPF